jgi:hypothetical protein
MATIRVEYAGEDGTMLMAEYVGVEAAVDVQTKLLTLTQHGIAVGGLTLDVVLAEFPEGRYQRWETMGGAKVPTVAPVVEPEADGDMRLDIAVPEEPGMQMGMKESPQQK